MLQMRKLRFKKVMSLAKGELRVKLKFMGLQSLRFKSLQMNVATLHLQAEPQKIKPNSPKTATASGQSYVTLRLSSGLECHSDEPWWDVPQSKINHQVTPKVILKRLTADLMMSLKEGFTKPIYLIDPKPEKGACDFTVHWKLVKIIK